MIARDGQYCHILVPLYTFVTLIKSQLSAIKKLENFTSTMTADFPDQTHTHTQILPHTDFLLISLYAFGWKKGGLIVKREINNGNFISFSCFGS